MTSSPASEPGSTCGLDTALRLIAGKWKPLILYFLYSGSQRYGELQRAVRDCSHKVLIQQLKELVADGVVARTDHHEVPPRVDYSLTPLGRTLAEALIPLDEWGTSNEAQIKGALAGSDTPDEPPVAREVCGPPGA